MPERPRPLIVDAKARETLPNPYWDEVKPFLVMPPEDRIQRFIHGGSPSIGSLRSGAGFAQVFELRGQLVCKYAWAITDPGSVTFVAEYSGGLLIEPMAGTGYWAYLLSWLGVKVKASDISPPAPGRTDNQWHPDTNSFVGIYPMDCEEAVTYADPAATLFLSWPPMSDDADRTVAAYQGNRIIHIGELGGCTGDDNLIVRLAKGWDEVDSYPIMQWAGIHDYITVWERKTPAADP